MTAERIVVHWARSWEPCVTADGGNLVCRFLLEDGMETWERTELERIAGELRNASEILAAALGALDMVLVEDTPSWPLYWQRLPQWAADRLGPDANGGTLGGAGCAVTCAAMMATATGCIVRPDELNRWLSEHNGYGRARVGGPRNLIIWAKVAEFCPALEWRARVEWGAGGGDPAVIRNALERGPVIAEVDFDYADMDVDQHFVVLLRWVGADEVEIADPWTGRREMLVERYFNPVWAAPKGKVARCITGLRLLQPRPDVDMDVGV